MVKYNKNILKEEEDIFIDEKYTNPWAKKQVIINFIALALEAGLDHDYKGPKRKNPEITKKWLESHGIKNRYEENWFIRMFNIIWNEINNILGNSVFKKMKEDELNNIVMDIVDDVYKENFDKILSAYSLNPETGQVEDTNGTVYEVKGYEETLNKDPFARSILEKLFGLTALGKGYLGFKASGSLTLRKYGTVLRSVSEDLHDIDGVIELEQFLSEDNAFEMFNWIRNEGIHLSKKISPSAKKKFRSKLLGFIEDQTWYKNIKNSFPTWTFENTFIGRDHKKGESITIMGYVEHPTEMEFLDNANDPDHGKLLPKRFQLDFFLRTSEGNYPEIFDHYYKDWKQIMEAKINMGRPKDMADLIFFVPTSEDKNKFTNKGFRFWTLKEEQDTIEEFFQDDLQFS